MTTGDVATRFSALWRSLEPIGRDELTGGYLRYAWSEADIACREWFVEEALDRKLSVETDGNGNIWAWWGDPSAGGAVVTGSHLDSVPHGGAFDGPLGIVSGLLAVDLLRERGITPTRPVGVVAFTEEEGSRFGLACLGSRLFTGVVEPEKARSLVDRHGVSLARAMAEAEVDPSTLGPQPERLNQLAAFVELHIEQGRALADLDAPVGVASMIWPHGRWRLDFTGEANHAGTTRMDQRRDPMLTFAYAVLAANKAARLAQGHATVGRVSVEPNATNAIPARVTGWLDARAPDQSILEEIVAAIQERTDERAGRDGTTLAMTAESISPATEFELALRDRLAAALGAPAPAGSAAAAPGSPAGASGAPVAASGSVPILATGAGHDAGILSAAGVPTAMLFVRNPTGISHAPTEYAGDADCAAGVEALTTVLQELACQ